MHTLDYILDEGAKFQNRMFISFPQFVYCSRDWVYFPKLSCLIAAEIGQIHHGKEQDHASPPTVEWKRLTSVAPKRQQAITWAKYDNPVHMYVTSGLVYTHELS